MSYASILFANDILCALSQLMDPVIIPPKPAIGQYAPVLRSILLSFSIRSNVFARNAVTFGAIFAIVNLFKTFCNKSLPDIICELLTMQLLNAFS